jgi:hypothetical protein
MAPYGAFAVVMITGQRPRWDLVEYAGGWDYFKSVARSTVVSMPLGYGPAS